MPVTTEAGEVFFEPAEQVITKFDATHQGTTFLTPITP